MERIKKVAGGAVFGVGFFCWTILSHFQWDKELDRSQKREFWKGMGAMAILPVRALAYDLTH